MNNPVPDQSDITTAAIDGPVGASGESAAETVPGTVAETVAELNCTGYRLRKATRRITALFDDALAPAGMTVTQFSILARLAVSGASPMSGLADRMGMDASTLTRTLKPLLQRGLIAHSQGADRRVKQVGLTDEGREAVALAVPYWRSAQQKVERALGGEVSHLHSLLGRLSKAVDRDMGSGR